MGAVILIVICACVVTLLMGWRSVPGLFGEWLGVFAGILSTPFFLEASYVVMGILIVVGLNSWRRARDGDEFVYLDQVEGYDGEKLPEHAKWAIYREKPLPLETISLLEEAEGALAIGDLDAASEAISAMGEDELVRNEVLRVRISLAEASNRISLAEELRKKLREEI